MKTTAIAIGISFALTSLSVSAQQRRVETIWIKGKILDAQSTAPVHGANIHYQGHRQTIISGLNGTFSIKDQIALPLTIVTTSVGYEPDTTTIHDLKPFVIRLRPEVRHLQEAEVMGRINTPQVSRRLDAATLKDNQYKSLAEVLLDIAGVGMLSTGTTINKPIVNGLYGNRLAIMNNGIKLESQQWGSDHAPEIDVFSSHSLTVAKGAESLRYGAEALGGAILISPKSWSQIHGFQGNLSQIIQSNGRGFQTAADLEGLTGINNLKFRFNTNYAKSGNRRAPDYYLNNTGQELFNFNIALGYQIKDALLELSYKNYDNHSGILSSTHIGDVQSFQERIAYGRPYPVEDLGFSYHIDAPRQQVKHQILQLGYEQKLNDHASLSAKYAFQINHRQEYDKRRAGRSAIPSMDLELLTGSLDLSYIHKMEHSQLTLGTQVENQVNNNIPGTFNTPLIPNYDSFTLGAYGIYQWNRNQWLYELGARFDHKTFNALGYDFFGQQYGRNDRFNNFSGNIGASYILDNHINFKSNLGLAWRAPSAQELYSQNIHQSTARYEKGNANLSSEQGFKWTNSINIQENKNFLNIDIYANYINNYIYARPNGEFIQNLAGTFPIWQFVQNKVILGGIDIQGKYQINSTLSYLANASYIYARNIDEDAYLPLIPPLSYRHRIVFDRVYEQSWINALQVALIQEINARQFATTTKYEMAPAPHAYQLLHTYVKMDHKFKKHSLSGKLEVNNLLNTTYKSYTDLFRYYAHGLGRNIQLSINYSF